MHMRRLLIIQKKLNHGEAVILGIRIASKFSLSNKLLSINEFKLIETHINNLNFNKEKVIFKKKLLIQFFHS